MYNVNHSWTPESGIKFQHCSTAPQRPGKERSRLGEQCEFTPRNTPAHDGFCAQVITNSGVFPSFIVQYLFVGYLRSAFFLSETVRA